MSDLRVTGLEANFLLFALDKYLGVDDGGRLLSAKHGYDQKSLQSLRDRLFDAHEHPEEDAEATGLPDDRTAVDANANGSVKHQDSMMDNGDV